MRITAWNVNGLRAAAKNGFAQSVAEIAPDVLLLQEIKARAEDLPKKIATLEGYVSCFHPATVRRGYSGVAIYAREQPDEWTVGVGDDTFDGEGRAVFARFGELVVASVYFPNSQEAGRRLDYRLAFNARFARVLDEQRQRGRTVVVGGDFNVAHREIDIARPQQNVGNPGFLPQERAWMDEFLADGWVDTWRRQEPETADVYSWWSYRAQARSKNIGWRLDYLCVDQAAAARASRAQIHCDVVGSDHCPVSIDFDGSQSRTLRKIADPREDSGGHEGPSDSL